MKYKKKTKNKKQKISFKKLKMNCNDEFTQHWECLEKLNNKPKYCRKTQAAQ